MLMKTNSKKALLLQAELMAVDALYEMAEHLKENCDSKEGRRAISVQAVKSSIEFRKKFDEEFKGLME